MTPSVHPIMGWVSPDPIGQALGTRMMRFDSPFGIDGLARWGGGRLDLLAVHAGYRGEGKGSFRNFIEACKGEFETICVWHIWNDFLPDALKRYGFRPDTMIDDDGAKMEGMRWDRPPTPPCTSQTPK